MSSDQGDEVPMAGYRYFADDANRPLYSPALKDWDVVVIELPRPAIGRPLKIAGGDETQSWAAGTSAWVSGWGSTDDGREGTDSDHLLATSVLILGDARCSQVYNFDSQTSLCAGVTVGEHDTCIGDSGGPLVVSLPSGEERLVGATSYGSKDCGNVAAPGVYARLAADPIRSRVQTLVQQLAGVDVVG
jgi:secreted trypsin-like serine protease